MKTLLKFYDLGKLAKEGELSLVRENKFVLRTVPELNKTSKKACLRQEELTRSISNLRNSEIQSLDFAKVAFTTIHKLHVCEI
jgi:hypothetical protein